MIVRALDQNGDWTFGRGSNNYLKNADAIGQSIKTRLKSFLGDCFFAVDEGIDWFNLLGSKNETGMILSAQIVIINTPNVTGLLQLSTNLTEDRKLSLSYSVDTVYTQGEPLTSTIGVI